MNMYASAIDKRILVLRVSLILAFLMAGIAKLAGVKDIVDIFTKIGLGDWFLYFTAATEILAALLMISTRTAFFGALLVIACMIGAGIVNLIVPNIEYAGARFYFSLLLGGGGCYLAWIFRPMELLEPGH
jgi:uncharacterized membrane protein YphA (DoxX/SURF4 family)